MTMSYHELIEASEKERSITLGIELCARDAIALRAIMFIPQIINEEVTIGTAEELILMWLSDSVTVNSKESSIDNYLLAAGLPEVSDPEEKRRLLADMLWWIVTLGSLKKSGRYSPVEPADDIILDSNGGGE